MHTVLRASSPSAPGDKRTRLGPPLVVFAVWLVALGPVLRPDHALYFRDHALLFHRLFDLVARAWLTGELPLWDPFAGGGEPLAAYPNAMAFSPLVAALLLPFDHFVLHDVFVAGFLLVAGLSMERLAAAYALAPAARALAAVAFMLAGPVVSETSLLPLLQTTAVLPLLLATLIHHARAPSLRSMLALALVTAWEALTLEPFSLFAVLVLSAVVAAIELVGAHTRPSPTRLVATSLGALVLAVLASAAAWVPLLALVSGSSRGEGFSFDQLSHFSVHPLRLLELALPGLSGDAVALGEVFGQRGGSAYFTSLTLGVVTVALATAGSARDRRTWPWAAALVVFLVLALGRNTPVIGWIVEVTPGLSSSRFPVKFMGYVALAAALLAGHGLDALLAEVHTPTRRGLVRLAVGAGLTFVAIAVALLAPEALVDGRTMPLDAALVRVSSAGLAAMIALVATLALFVAVRRTRAPIVAWLFPIAVAVELGVAAQPHVPSMPVDALRPSALRETITREAPRPLVFTYDQYFDAGAHASPDTRALAQAWARRPGPQLIGRDGLHFLLDQDLNDTRSRRWHAGFDLLVHADETARLNALRRTGHTHVVVEARVDETRDLVASAREELVPNVPTTVFRVKRARPLPAFAATVVPADGPPGVLERLFTETSTASFLVDRRDADRLGLATRASVGERPGAGRVEQLVETPSRASMIVTADVPGAVLVPISFGPGWSATVNQEAVELVAGEHFWSLVPVPAGRSELVLTYEPASIPLGLALSATGLALIAALALLGRRGRA
ncbi:YfhO family protein [Myxococcota bacterium]|nr:YfhO family protein [Myxococcota bacterium]